MVGGGSRILHPLGCDEVNPRISFPAVFDRLTVTFFSFKDR